MTDERPRAAIYVRARGASFEALHKIIDMIEETNIEALLIPDGATLGDNYGDVLATMALLAKHRLAIHQVLPEEAEKLRESALAMARKAARRRP